MELRLKLALRTQISNLRKQIASDVAGGTYGRYSEFYNREDFPDACIGWS